MKRWCYTVILATAALLAASLVRPAVASATEPAGGVETNAVGGCVVRTTVLFGSCKTAAVPAGADGRVYFELNTGVLSCNYIVRDIITWVVVGDGGFAGHWGGSVGGLTNYYRLELHGCVGGSSGFIY